MKNYKILFYQKKNIIQKKILPLRAYWSIQIWSFQIIGRNPGLSVIFEINDATTIRIFLSDPEESTTECHRAAPL